MGIPISNYIDVSTRVVKATSGDISFAGLVFSSASMKATTSSDPYQQIKTDYAAGKAVVVSVSELAELFDSTAPVLKFAQKVAGYGSSNSIVAVAKTLSDDTPATAFSRVVAEFDDFGSFTFLGDYDDDDLAEVASASSGSGYAMFVATTKSDMSTTAPKFANFEHVFVVLGNTEDSVNYAAWMPMAWYGNVNYGSAKASQSIDYRSFGGESATVSNQSDKNSADALNVNYIGKVQDHGIHREFMQRGVMMDGTDLGVFRDKMWIQYSIFRGWFDLNDSGKVEASGSGAARVKLMVVGVANKAIENGCILNNKALTDAQIAEIVEFTGDEAAPEKVATGGYYIDAKIVPQGNKYACKYTLVYAKGDHVEKVIGTHVLV